jgi:hypothetical protein
MYSRYIAILRSKAISLLVNKILLRVNQMDNKLTKTEKEQSWLGHQESFDDDFSEPALGDDWREKAYSAKEQLVDAFVEFDPEHFLVAHGEKKDDKCGSFLRRKVKAFRVCFNLEAHKGIVDIHGFDYTGKVPVKRVFYSCNRPECPSCGVSGWAVRESGRAEGILRYASDKLHYKSQHIIISPPQDFSGSYDDLKKYILKAMLRRGIVGGCYVYHHFRYHGKNETYVGEKAHYFVGRHFHVLGFIKGGYGNCRNCIHQRNGTFAKCKEGCNGFEGVTRRAFEKDGVIAKVKGERKSIGGTLWYELSHASLRKGVKKQVVVNWFGVCGRNKLRIRKGDLPQKEHLCPLCASKMFLANYVGEAKRLLSMMSAYPDGHIFWLDAKDEHGNWLWSAIHEDRHKKG